MNIEYPPMLSGNSREQILELRSYLYRLADQLNFELLNIEETLPSTKDDDIEAIPKGQRLILSTDSGWIRGTSASAYGANLTGIEGFRLFVAIISNGTESVPISLYRHGTMIKGSVDCIIGGGMASVVITAEITKSPDIILRQATYQLRTASATTSGIIPDVAGGPFDGYVLRELYAIVI